MEYTSQINSLMTTAGGMPLSTARLQIVEEAVRLADIHQDIDLGIEVRQFLMADARGLLRGDVLAAAFVWSLAQFDREPCRFGDRNLLTEYSWVIGQLANLPTVPRVQLEELLADFSRRLAIAGLGQRDFFLAQRAIAPDLGDKQLARAAVQALAQLPTSPWELTDSIITELFIGNEDDALRLGGFLEEQPSTQRRLPDDACAYLLLPLLKRGHIEDAQRLLQRSFKSYVPQQCYYWWYGEMLKFLTLTNELARATRMYAECQNAIKEFTDPLTRLHFALDAVVLFDRLIAQKSEYLTARLPDYVPVQPDQRRYSVPALRAWMEQQALELARLFDGRNGTCHFQDQWAERIKLQQLNV